jgi:hypothetical protein
LPAIEVVSARAADQGIDPGPAIEAIIAAAPVD